MRSAKSGRAVAGFLLLPLWLSVMAGLAVAQEPQGGKEPGAVRQEMIQKTRESLQRLDEERQRLLDELQRLTEERPSPAEREVPAAQKPPERPPERPAAGQEVPTLETVVVTGTRSKQQIGNIPSAITVVTEEEIRQGRKTINLEESLRRVPGLVVRDQLGGSSRVTMSIRGIGATTRFGAQGYRLLVDGIPKNNAGGSAQDFANIDLQSAERIEVVRGPHSALYGNQSGGIINVITKEGRPVPFVSYQQTIGSFGLFQEKGQFGGQALDGRFSYFGSGFWNNQDGFRDNSSFQNAGVHLKTRLSIDDRSKLVTIFGYDNLFQEIPGGLTAEEMRQSRKQAGPFPVRARLDEFRAGLIYTREIFGQDEAQFTGYYIPRRIPSLFQPIGVLRINQIFINRGLNFRYLNTAPIFGFGNRATVGADFQNTPITTGTFSVPKGTALSETEEEATTVGGYFFEEFNLLDNLILSVGGRFDSIKFKREQVLTPGAPGSRFAVTFDRFSPKFGIVYRPIPTLSLYANYSEAFEAPVIGTLRNSPRRDGEFVPNTEAKPQVVKAVEVGARGTPWHWLSFELALFRQEIDNFFVTSTFQRPPPAVGNFDALTNAGKVDQLGFELGSTIFLPFGFQVALSYTFSDFEFDRFVSSKGDFSGNVLPGVPRHNFFGEVSYRHPSGAFGAVEIQGVGSFFVNDENTVKNNSYVVANLRLGYDGRLFGHDVSYFVGVNNLSNTKFVSQVEFNAGDKRFFNPSPGVNAFGGIKLTY